MHSFFADYLKNLKELHNDIRNALEGLPPEALDWKPAPEANSLGVLVVHTVGAERFLIGDFVAGEPSGRDREAEFRVQGLDVETLKQKLDDSFTYISTALEKKTLDDLTTQLDFRGNQSSVAWVLEHALKHTAAHLGHIQLTRQLWDERER